jgi:hypothetical protein
MQKLHRSRPVKLDVYALINRTERTTGYQTFQAILPSDYTRTGALVNERVVILPSAGERIVLIATLACRAELHR